MTALLIVLSLALLVQQPRPPITFEPTSGVPSFAVREPVLRVKPGDVVETRTFSRPGDYYERAGGGWPGEVGPFHIEGATSNDTLVVKILRVRLNRDTAVSAATALMPFGLTADTAVSRFSRTRRIFTTRVSFDVAPSMWKGPTSPGHPPPARS